MVGRERLVALVRSERHCTGPNAATANAPRPGNAPTAVIEPSPTGATGIADLGNAGRYEDEYVKTAQGWRFKARTVVSAQEQAAKLTARDFSAIRRLAGTELGQFEDVYVTGTDGVKQFRSSGVSLGLSAEGVTGRAYLKNNGGHYEDVYVRASDGTWRFKSRVHVSDNAPSSGATTNAPTGAAR